MFLVRPASVDDSAAVFALAEAFATSFQVEQRAFDRSYAELLVRPDARLAIAEKMSVAVGYCLAFEHPTFFANGRVCWVEELMVAEQHRRHGTGRALLADTEKWAEQRGAQMVAMATRRAAAFYEAAGYDESATYFRRMLAVE